MMIQVTAYEVLGALQVQVTRAEASESGYEWSHLILEQIDPVASEPVDVWDWVWYLGQLLSERALERGSQPPRA